MPVEIVATERAGAFVVRLDGRDQSHVDLADPGRLDFPYVRRIGDVLDAAAPTGTPLRMLHVGGAGLTVPRYVAHTRPGSAQVVLEPDAELTERVRADLPLPRRTGVKVRPVPGRPGLASVRDDSQDVVVVDAFAGGRVPGGLVTAEAAAEYGRVLTDGGLLVLNLVDAAPFGWARRALAAVRTVLPTLLVTAEPATLRARRPGNLLVVASRGGVPTAALSERAATSPAPYRVLGPAAVSDTLGGGSVFTDSDAEDSPATQD